MSDLVRVVAGILLLSAIPGLATAQTPENTSSACRDAVDNDLDGYIDCRDQDCGDFRFCDSNAPRIERAPPAPGARHHDAAGAQSRTHHRNEGQATVGWILFGVGGVGSVAGLITMLDAGSGSSYDAGVAILTVGGLGVALGLILVLTAG